MFNFGSICSGIEAASMAWEPLGASADWFSEIEKFPSAVLNYRWPNTPNLGDMCDLPAFVRAGLIQAPDVLVGGTPCQAFSVAGLRNSLDDDRGQLTLKYVELLNAIDEQRDVGDECVAVWENVPGVLTTKDNAFGCFLGALAGEGCELVPSGDKWTKSGVVFGPRRTIAWRILDAQYFGVAQRRRRVFVVASARRGFDPTKVLFESEGVRRDIAPSRETGEETPGFSLSGFAQYRKGVGTLRANGGDQGGGSETLVKWPAQTAATLNAAFGDKQGLEDQHALGGASWFVPDVIGALTANGPQDMGAPQVDANQYVATPIHDKTTRHAGKTGKGSGNGLGVGNESDPMFTLTTGDKHAVSVVHGTQDPIINNNLALPLGCNNGQENALHYVDAIRRITPIECERLQGFPDNHTRIPYRGKAIDKCPDGPRYKAIGNSKAVPVVRWIGRRLIAELNK